MAAKKTIVVVGATGNQGGSVANTFLGLSNWHVRAVTRDPSSKAAQALNAKGAEVVRADLADPSSLAAAFAGAHAIFLNTNFWEVYQAARAALEAEKKDVAAASHTAFERETSSGKNAAVAAAAVPTLERFVYSALPSVATGGTYTRSLHPEAKAWIAQYVEKEQPALAAKMSLVYPGAYVTNNLIAPRLDESSGEYRVFSPIHADTHLSVVDPQRSMGPFVRALVESEPAGTKLWAYDSDLSMGQLVDAWSQASGRRAVLVPVTAQSLHEKGALWEHLDGVDKMNEMRGDYTAAVPDLIRPSQLKAKVNTQTYEEWLKGRNWDELLA